MIRVSGTVYYRDGGQEAYEGGGAMQADWELWAVRHGYPTTPTPETLTSFPVKTWQLYLAYCAVGAQEGFDVWRKQVLDVDSDDQPEVIPPTLPEATAAR